MKREDKLYSLIGQNIDEPKGEIVLSEQIIAFFVADF
jgi:hypothetical protein